MPPQFRSIKRKKRKFTGNVYTRRLVSQETTSTMSDSSSEATEVGEMSNESIEQNVNVSASERKLDFECTGDESESPEDNEGFRFIDVEILAEIMHTFWCPDCRCGHVILKEC